MRFRRTKPIHLTRLRNRETSSFSTQTSTSGSQTISRSYYAYGSTRSSSGTLQTDRTYTGQKQDGTGLLYYNARYYDPALGTFLSPDTLVPDPNAVIDYNRFLYVRGNPLSLNDPTGHCATTTNGEPDMNGDGECWQMANAIAGLGYTEQGFWDDWGGKNRSEWWLDNIANQSFATLEYLTPFYERYSQEFETRTGLNRPFSLEPGPPHPIEAQAAALRDVASGRCEIVDCTGLAIDAVGFIGTIAAVGASPLCGPAAPGCAAIGARGGFIVGTAATVTGLVRTGIRFANGNASGTDLTVTIVTSGLSPTRIAPVSGFAQILYNVFGSPFRGGQ